MMIGELDNDLLAICSCPSGHRYLAHQAHSAPEVIFSAGARAFLSGFYSESVVTLTAALERGYELFVKVFLLAAGKTGPGIEDAWKELRNSSERQTGAFCVAYFASAGTPWKIDQGQAAFRNKVAHRGYIATREEAHDYGEYVTVKLDAVMSFIKTHRRDSFFEYLEFAREVVYRRAQSSGLELCFSGASSLEWNNAGHAHPSFDDLLAANAALLGQFPIDA